MLDESVVDEDEEDDAIAGDADRKDDARVNRSVGGVGLELGLAFAVGVTDDDRTAALDGRVRREEVVAVGTGGGRGAEGRTGGVTDGTTGDDVITGGMADAVRSIGGTVGFETGTGGDRGVSACVCGVWI